MKARVIAQWRMHNLGIWGPPAHRPADVVARLGAMQAQEFPYAKWSIAQRTSGATEADIDKLFDKGAFLRTHVLRPTWHFVAPRDIRWMLDLTAPRVKKMMSSADRELDLDERLYSRSNRLITKALTEAGQLTRKELVGKLKRSKISGDGRRFGHIILRAELDGLICSGARRDREHTYALLDERVSKSTALDGDAALAELAGRYFTTRAPATLKDFSWWSSLKMVDCKRAVELLADELEHREVNDRIYWFSRGSEPPKPTRGAVDLVQVYDECVVSYTLSRDPLTANVKGDIPRNIMFFWHPILLDGQLIGHWRRRTKGELSWLEVFTYERSTKTTSRSLDVAVRRFEDFAERSLETRMAEQPRR